MRRPYKEALAIAKEFASKFVQQHHEFAGSIRRKELTIGDIDIVTSTPLNLITSRIEQNIYAKKVNGGEKKMDVDYKGMRFNIYFALPYYWGSMMFFLTGPAGYTIAYRRRAKEKGWKLDQYGLHNKRGEVIASRTEEQIYKAFGKPYKNPELRGK